MSLKCDFKELSKSMHCDNLLNKMQKGLYDKIIANQQILKTWKILIFFATKLKVQLSGTLKKHSEHKVSWFTETWLNNSETTLTQKAKSWN